MNMRDSQDMPRTVAVARTADPSKTSVIGKSVTRLEDGPLVRGDGSFAADINFVHQLHMRVVRSQIAHGRIIGINTDEALAQPGVIAVWTHADVAEVPPIPFRATTV